MNANINLVDRRPGKFSWRLDLGAVPMDGEGTRFRIWAPKVTSLSVRFISKKGKVARLQEEGNGYFSGTVQGVGAGDRYYYLLDNGTERPDPASRFQPEGVHGPSQVVDPEGFSWTDKSWSGIPQEDYVIYELHVGTFSPEGTFDGVIEALDYLCELGITAVELMPVAQFPGERNWGYDGVYPFAPHNYYGGPDGLKRLIDACHRKGLAVILDVVYNHQGPEGNYSGCYGHYRTDRYHTPWGDAINYDGPDSDQVRHFFISIAMYWITEYHADALRLDAVHEIFDFGACHILEEIAMAVHAQARRLGREIHVIAESDLNDVRILKPRRLGGYNLDAQWSDDFHHSLHTLLTGERDGYYRDFGRVAHLAKAMSEGFVNDGCYSSYRRRRHGNPSGNRPGRQFVVCSQNHDQLGNRMYGERLTALVSFESLKLASGVLLISPAIPLLFMGEEYGETAPFLYFIDHSDAPLTEAVRKGRREAFQAAGHAGEPPDAAAKETFIRSKLDWSLLKNDSHQTLHTLYRTLIIMRKSTAALAAPDRINLNVHALEEQRLLFMERWNNEDRFLCLFCFADEETNFSFPAARGRWRKLIDSADVCWNGPGSSLPSEVIACREVTMNGRSMAVYRKEVWP